jgi:hypothetical protein
MEMLGEMLEACQDFFWNFDSIADYAEGRPDLERDETALIGGSRIFGVRCVFASLFWEARFCTAREINPGAVVRAVPSALGVLR